MFVDVAADTLMEKEETGEMKRLHGCPGRTAEACGPAGGGSHGKHQETVHFPNTQSRDVTEATSYHHGYRKLVKDGFFYMCFVPIMQMCVVTAEL